MDSPGVAPVCLLRSERTEIEDKAPCEILRTSKSRYFSNPLTYHPTRKPAICLTSGPLEHQPLWQAKQRILKRPERKASFGNRWWMIARIRDGLGSVIARSWATPYPRRTSSHEPSNRNRDAAWRVISAFFRLFRPSEIEFLSPKAICVSAMSC